MTIEEKARSYEEALEKARKLYNSEETSADVEIACETIFPELVESEDERIRKMCMRYLDREYQHCSFPDDKKNIEKCIAWLEKQGKSKWTDEDEHHLMMCLECVEECAFQDREDFSKTTDWLKSIKKRMEEQQ